MDHPGTSGALLGSADAMRATAVTQRKHVGTMPQYRRLLWALGRLRSGHTLTAPELAREFEVNVRTAYRDIDRLRDEWRLPLEFDRGRNSYRLTEPTTALPVVPLTQGELLAVYFAEKVVAQYRNTPFEAELRSAFDKLREFLPGEVRVSSESLDNYLSLDPGPLHTPDARVFSDVLSGQRLRRALLVRYRSLSSNRTSERRIQPYRIFNHRGDWYVAAWDEVRREVRIFALHRVERATLTTDRYEIPPEFDFERWIGDAFGIEKGERARVSLRFAARQARWIRERRWHASARLEEQDDGGLVLRLDVAQTSEVRRWVLQFGSEAEVLEPESLRREVAADLAAALAAYRRRGRAAAT